MADIFISYSRKDSAFGRRLHAKLLEEKRDVWMDWEDIPDTVEWWSKIREGILASDNVAVIISPESIASPICNLEMAYARELNKRILPLLYRDTDETKALVELVTQPLNDLQRALLQDRDLLELGRDNWKVLAGLNWINFTDEARFQEKSQNLTKALDTDFEYVDEHTQLLVRATDWENRKRSPSLLLRGDDLAAAEVWLENAGGKNPQPAVLHQEYIAESRRVQNEEERRISRLRWATVIFGMMVVLALIVTVLAGLTTRNAQSTQATVEWQATYFALEQGRAGTLAAGGVILPAIERTQAPPDFIATLTEIAVLNNWQPVVQEFDGVDMVQVPPGCFYMGSVLVLDEQPVNEVCFDKSFWIDRYEVTNEQFDQFGGLAQSPGYWPSPKQPRTEISWFEARDFCELREARLPTEAEWEYAARGVNSQVYSWGNVFAADKVVYYGNSGEDAADVGTRPGGLSWVGAHDMSGNVWEWVSSTHEGYPYDPDDGREDPDQIDVARVLRGGDYVTDERSLRAAFRLGSLPEFVTIYFGFRCARSE